MREDLEINRDRRTGQFGPSNTTPQSTIDDDGLYSVNTGGSYEFPQEPESAEQVVEFWSNVEIPRQVSRSVIHNRERDRQRQYSPEIFEKGVQSWLSKMSREEAEQQVKQLLEERIPPIDRRKVNPIIRMSNMYLDSEMLPPRERDAVRNAKLSMGGEAVTPQEVWDRYNVARLLTVDSHVFEYKNDPDEAMGQVAQSIREMQADVANIRALAEKDDYFKDQDAMADEAYAMALRASQ